ncbi:type II secretion system protein [Pseudorhodoferax sp. LjRoot39]|uniref:type II secretion system protein n=1 Tax=Pseudorhodoferax sp. LjRoot39 TaxID=3342328 RepID=UPI003ECCD29F
MNTRRAAGFTLIELLVTLALVGLLAAIAVPMADLAARRGKEQELRESLRSIRRAIDAYKQAGDEGRIQRPVDGSGYPPSLRVLVDGVADLRDPAGRPIRFLRAIPRDPLSDPERQSAEASWGKRAYASPADVPAEGRDVFDVYSRDPRSGLDGVPYRQW